MVITSGLILLSNPKTTRQHWGMLIHWDFKCDWSCWYKSCNRCATEWAFIHLSAELSCATARLLHAAPQSVGVSVLRELGERERSGSLVGVGGVGEQQPSINNPLPGPEMTTAGFRGAAFPLLAPNGRQTVQIETIWFQQLSAPRWKDNAFHYRCKSLSGGRGSERRAAFHLCKRLPACFFLKVAQRQTDVKVLAISLCIKTTLVFSVRRRELKWSVKKKHLCMFLPLLGLPDSAARRCKTTQDSNCFISLRWSSQSLYVHTSLHRRGGGVSVSCGALVAVSYRQLLSAAADIQGPRYGPPPTPPGMEHPSYAWLPCWLPSSSVTSPTVSYKEVK